ncbi:hypothetical protein [Actinomadura sp. HBU206391]|uniref:hypothetical protein n=1 Tax=Actinomadura sp. HBU206391 TaxID=2731692 RepID=UPI0016502014|nr:hypothetical protein [Actinomadura sp. HBU206391]MBC6456757.1 hypothetical protein [Actinomadura sp. HBU206391]
MTRRLTASALAACAVVLGTPAPTMADCECWHYVRAEGSTENTTFSEVSAPSFTTALAAGSRGSTPLLAHWNGVRWREAVLPLPRDTAMEGVAASSIRDAWAVGYTPGGTAYTARWAGDRTWEAVPMRAREPSFPRAVDARSPRDAWIVGSSGHPHARAASWHWNGRHWQAVPVPDLSEIPGQGHSELVAVSALAADDVWAVGSGGTTPPHSRSIADRGDGAVPHALIAHWDGRAWTSVPAEPSAGGGPSASVLADVVALSADDVWAVGTAWPGTDVPMAWHWNGTVWQNVAIPWKRGRLYSVAGDGRGGVWAAGESAAGTALLAHWNGERWDVSGAPTPGDTEPGEGAPTGHGAGAVRGLANARGTSYLWAVGAYARPGPNEPVPHLLTWTNAPHHR